MGEVIKFEKSNGLSGEIQEKNKRRSIMSRKEKRKTKSSRGRVESRGREVQEE